MQQEEAAYQRPRNTVEEGRLTWTNTIHQESEGPRAIPGKGKSMGSVEVQSHPKMEKHHEAQTYIAPQSIKIPFDSGLAPIGL